MKEKTKKLLVMLEAIMLILWIVVTAIFVTFVFKSGTICLANPLVFGAKALSEKNQVDLKCDCQFENEPEFIIEVTKDGWILFSQQEYFKNTGLQYNESLYNLSNAFED